MTPTEATQLAMQLGVELPKKRQADALWNIIVHERGLEIGIDNLTGDWVVLDAQHNILARVT